MFIYDSIENQRMDPESYCELKKGRSFHPYSKLNVKDKFVTVFGVKTFFANSDFKETFQIKKGSVVHQLAEYSEGVCLIEIDGKTSKHSCLDYYEDFVLIEASPFRNYRMIHTTCDNGMTGWLHEEDMY